jgi:diadenosine tetraphosphate (Ap4A) HIT family hydrolase
MHATCLTCRANRGEPSTPGGVIHDDGLWRLEHAFEPVPLAGWLIVKPLRHVEAFSDLTAEEAAAFGPLARRATSALMAVLQPKKVYLCLVAEAENAAHIHFHLVPRFEDTPPELRGPGIFALLREAMTSGRNRALLAEVERVVDAVRRHRTHSS